MMSSRRGFLASSGEHLAILAGAPALLFKSRREYDIVLRGGSLLTEAAPGAGMLTWRCSYRRRRATDRDHNMRCQLSHGKIYKYL